ncbi:Craniofacial development protein, putative [Perkinsus marinus ATCC 50983]|uniref:Craniofacial development protein, putative n=1 Tax=Perkinsus marinus (strain ATCC 50983 / TXsc) TaxID=423536 RepID=C5KS18_PERM5|nr:Craniofacial development protein, putative [Perkinsus marinus ATCC 50983]EER12709.1 Craniofacial development protein, putative [Perkinsus marinus ATCC 50983]|eukprot:XP_002780914.1 Craniofacial development protein, putative [Perkinsus marinus ATCC 50983]
MSAAVDELLSDDNESDDSDYVDSGGSSESSYGDEAAVVEIDEDARKERDQRLQQEYATMKEARNGLYVPPSEPHRDSLWESFNRRQATSERQKDRTRRGLGEMLSKIASTSLKDSPEEIDIVRYKKEARASSNGLGAPIAVAKVLAEVRKADKVEIDSHVKYAGRTVNVRRVVSKSSVEGAKHLRKAQRDLKTALGGSLGSLDAYLRGLRAGQVTSVEKSSAEWSRFKASSELDGLFEKDRRDGYLHKRAFLEAADTREYDKRKEAEKKARQTAQPKV